MEQLRSNEHIVTLSGGRRLGLAEYGDPRGAPVLVFHGLPGSRRQRHPDESIPRELGARELHLERPGFGLSDSSPGRTLLGWAADVAETCDRLGLEGVRVAGVSGGGPYALACGDALGRRVLRIVVASGVGPPGAAPPSDFAVFTRLAFALAPHASWSLRPFAWMAGALSQRMPRWYFEVLAAGLNAADKRILARADVRAMLAEDLSEAFAQSSRAFAEDLALIASPWGFDLGKIGAPLALWHGIEDRIVPAAASRTLAARLPHAELRLLPGEGHFFMLERWREILGWLMR
jgi:pimeloyl-ACP methyl ester carboxylesterase